MSTSSAHHELDLLFHDRLQAPAREAVVLILDAFKKTGRAALESRFATLPRKVGRDPVPGSIETIGETRIDLRALRACDVAAAWLLHRAYGTAHEDLIVLYFQGDALERSMLLRALSFLPCGPATERLLEEAHRTNDQFLFEAAFADSDLASRALSQDAYRRVVLKFAFIDLPLERLLGWERRVDEALSSMLLDLMTEREAAGRAPWRFTLEVAARAPTDAVRATIERYSEATEVERRADAARAREVLRPR